jgi:hypothetical protein
MFRFRALWPVLCALRAAASPALPVDSGPLYAENLYPPLLPFLAAPADAPGEPGKRGFELSLAASYGNDFHWDPKSSYPELEVLLDAELLRFSMSASWAPARGLELGARLSLLGAYGGFLDGAIEGLHGFFWLPNGARGLYPANHCNFRIVNGGQVLVDLEGPFWAMGDLVLSGKWTFLGTPARGFGAALQAAFSLPIGSEERLTSSGRPNAALGVLASWRRPPFAAYGGLRYLYLGEPDWGPVLGFRPHNLAFVTCLQWAPSARLAWLLQADGLTLPYLHPHPWLSGLSGTISLGSRFRVGPRLLLELHFSEELFSFATLDIAAGCVAKVAL